TRSVSARRAVGIETTTSRPVIGVATLGISARASQRGLDMTTRRPTLKPQKAPLSAGARTPSNEQSYGRSVNRISESGIIERGRAPFPLRAPPGGAPRRAAPFSPPRTQFPQGRIAPSVRFL